MTTSAMTVERWERRAEVPLILLALAFLVAYAWPVLDPRLDPDARTVLNAVSWTVWGAFAVDLLIRLVLAEHRARYALSHWYDVALVALPLLRPLRLLRLLALVRILDRSASANLAGRVLVYVGGAAGRPSAWAPWPCSMPNAMPPRPTSRPSAPRCGGPARRSRRSATASTAP